MDGLYGDETNRMRDMKISIPIVSYWKDRKMKTETYTEYLKTEKKINTPENSKMKTESMETTMGNQQ